MFVCQRTLVLLAYRERDPRESEWFTRASKDFHIQVEQLEHNWKERIRFTPIQSNAGHPSSSTPSLSSTGVDRFRNESRPLIIYSMRRRRQSPSE